MYMTMFLSWIFSLAHPRPPFASAVSSQPLSLAMTSTSFPTLEKEELAFC